MFMDIQKFSDYAASLTPQEIMGNLSQIFGGFDALLPKYPLLTKIKLIGDVYMVGSGLFTPGEDPKNHAEQTLRFALEALQALDEINVKLDSNLSIRIGINTGGPIIAGVLGTDKPVFDIIGDPINIAARLQSTDIAGRVQISEGTYELLKDMDFQIEPRGEIWLKGKGNRPAYLVQLLSQFPFSISGQVSAQVSMSGNALTLPR
jgi:class 3 adenylate cyclase